MRVVQLPDVESVRVTCDGDEFTAWRRAGAGAIELDLTIGDHALVRVDAVSRPGRSGGARARRLGADRRQRLTGRAEPGGDRRGCELSLLLGAALARPASARKRSGCGLDES